MTGSRSRGSPPRSRCFSSLSLPDSSGTRQHRGKPGCGGPTFAPSQAQGEVRPGFSKVDPVLETDSVNERADSSYGPQRPRATPCTICRGVSSSSCATRRVHESEHHRDMFGTSHPRRHRRRVCGNRADARGGSGPDPEPGLGRKRLRAPPATSTISTTSAVCMSTAR